MDYVHDDILYTIIALRYEEIIINTLWMLFLMALRLNGMLILRSIFTSEQALSCLICKSRICEGRGGPNRDGRREAQTE